MSEVPESDKALGWQTRINFSTISRKFISECIVNDTKQTFSVTSALYLHHRYAYNLEPSNLLQDCKSD